MNRAFGRETFNLCVDLLCNGKSGVCCKISASALAAEDAALFAQGAVTVGTGHAAIWRDLINLFSKPLSQHIVQRVVWFFSPFGHTV